MAEGAAIRFFKRNLMEIIFLIPLLALVGTITLYPIARSIYLAFLQSNNQIGLGNFQYVFHYQDVTTALINTAFIVALALTMQFLISLLTALLLNRSFFGRSFFRTVIMIPFGVATVVSGIMFTFLFTPSPQSWYLNSIIVKLGISNTGINWIRPSWVAILSLAIADSWKNFPLIMLILLGGLASIPASQYESAAIDGANFLQQFRHITMPNLYPFIMMAVTIRAIQEFNILALALVLVGSYPTFLGPLAYTTFTNYGIHDANYASAIAMVLLGLISLFILVYIAISRRLGMEV